MTGARRDCSEDESEKLTVKSSIEDACLSRAFLCPRVCDVKVTLRSSRVRKHTNLSNVATMTSQRQPLSAAAAFVVLYTLSPQTL
jgi:hypothetical protein